MARARRGGAHGACKILQHTVGYAILVRQRGNCESSNVLVDKEIRVAVQKGAGAGSNLRAFYIVLAVVAIAGIAMVGNAVLGGSGSAATAPVELEGIEDARRLYDLATPVVMGDPSAPVKIVEFGDYQCPGCGAFATRVKPQIKARYVDTGQAQFVFYDFPLTEIHPHAFLAARAARCAGDQDRFWEYHDVIFARQGSWSYARTAPIEQFTGYATELGLDAGAFQACLESDAHAEAVTANRKLGEQLGVNATPTLIIDNRRISNPLDIQAVGAVIEESMQSEAGV